MKTKNILKTLAFSFALAFSSSAFAESPNNVIGDITMTPASSGIEITWDAATNADGTPVDHYRVYVDTHSVPDSETYAENFDTETAESKFTLTSFQGKSLVSGTTYYVSVTSVNAFGEESLSYSKEASLLYSGKGAVTSSSTTKATTTSTSTKSSSADASLRLVSAVAQGPNTVLVGFNHSVKLPTAVVDAFSILSATGKTLEVSAMKDLGNGQVELTTAAQTDAEKYTVTALSSITSDTGTPVVSGVTDSATFLGTTEVMHSAFFEGEQEVVKDTTPPEDVTNLGADFSLDEALKKFRVSIHWGASANSAGDLDHQNYYEQEGDNAYGTAIRVEKDKTSYDRVLEGGKRYTFKISTVDATGNESTGAITSIILPETGPAALLGLVGMFSAGAAHMIRRKKQN